MTLRISSATDSDHVPCVLISQYYESHPNDSRVTGPYDIAMSVSARYGTGGGNVPLVLMYEIANTKQQINNYSNPGV